MLVESGSTRRSEAPAGDGMAALRGEQGTDRMAAVTLERQSRAAGRAVVNERIEEQIK